MVAKANDYMAQMQTQSGQSKAVVEGGWALSGVCSCLFSRRSFVVVFGLIFLIVGEVAANLCTYCKKPVGAAERRMEGSNDGFSFSLFFFLPPSHNIFQIKAAFYFIQNFVSTGMWLWSMCNWERSGFSAPKARRGGTLQSSEHDLRRQR